MAVHGSGMHAGYWDARMASGLSLLELGAKLGFTVWAPDRPGIGASAELPATHITLTAQVDLLHEAIDRLTDIRETGCGVLLVGHSYGLKVAWAMAGQRRNMRLLGVDGSGSGIGFPLGRVSGARASRDRHWVWGPLDLYPDGIFAGELPLYQQPAVQNAEHGAWPDYIAQIGPHIDVPLRITFAEYERLWSTDPDHLEVLREFFSGAPFVDIAIERGAGHNISLGWAARSYHLKVLAFAEYCCRAKTDNNSVRGADTRSGRSTKPLELPA